MLPIPTAIKYSIKTDTSKTKNNNKILYYANSYKLKIDGITNEETRSHVRSMEYRNGWIDPVFSVFCNLLKLIY